MATVAQSGVIFSAQALTADVTSSVFQLYEGQALRVSSASGTRVGQIVFEVTSDSPAAIKNDTAEWSSGTLWEPGVGYFSDLYLRASTAFSKIFNIASRGTYGRLRYIAGTATGGALNAAALRKQET